MKLMVVDIAVFAPSVNLVFYASAVRQAEARGVRYSKRAP